MSIDVEGAAEIARRSRGTPRLANRLLKRVRDFAQVRHDGSIDEDIAAEALAFFEVDHLGLDAMDNKILDHARRDVLAAGRWGSTRSRARWARSPTRSRTSTSPTCLQLGLLARTPKGRQATARAYEHLGIAPPSDAAEPGGAVLMAQEPPAGRQRGQRGRSRARNCSTASSRRASSTSCRPTR